ncbi:tyrosine/tryptophan monooxygenase, putative [Perkinsus marinus ATCC 50983]|uniref:phenylalanine 4-monooxygenase n=1 Tax=Perkinsus marinus (strain ATCC 50983 / TXsc) TaxID=423536 RepID=C5LA00_PERM5|nr:tyrosine/tryptophan monooxygenase, putative [Perkinsus marinus ATCC 50983]EER06256.1 tyrosine/tryptophan monooxygenase, putative [Perkinsus marinus ATCC 50983]|eukprot:XP_002774440.1 tyrosine/tryptophan monooxygenase, putative [Perkinsus marinus ATCC 50983]
MAISCRVRPFCMISRRMMVTTLGGEENRIAFTLHDKPGSLVEALSIFSRRGISLSHVSNRFKIAAPDVPWFPRHISDLDQFSKSTLDAGDQLESDHPGFTDPEYRARREEIAKVASKYRGADGPVPQIEYTEKEVATWGYVWDELTKLYPRHACKEHNDALQALTEAGIYGPRKIPQLNELSDFVSARTGFQFRPVTGLLSGRDFLNALAFRVFFSTQYVRHHSVPMYTPEPDVIHELLGHAPMFLNPDFADFTQYIGLASLGASDDVIKKLAACYWFSVEFGLLIDLKGAVKAYGAGVLSSYGELLHSTSPTNPSISIKPWDPEEAANEEYPITKMQPVYFAAKSMEDAKIQMKAYCDRVSRPFHCVYDSESQSVFTDVDVYTRPVAMK